MDNISLKSPKHHGYRVYSSLQLVFIINVQIFLLISGSATSTSTTEASSVTFNFAGDKSCSYSPKFRIDIPDTNRLDDDSVIYNYNETSNELTVLGRITITLECLSTNPIDFDFEGHLVNKLSSVETQRRFQNDSTECFAIVVKFDTNREATGRYKCWNIESSQTTTVPTSASVYIYANGGSPPYLLHGDTEKEFIEVKAKSTDDYAILPCMTTNPNVRIALYKSEAKEYVPILGKFDPQIGFNVSLKDNPSSLNPFGKYKCIAQNSTLSNSSDFDVFVKLVEDEAKLTKLGYKESNMAKIYVSNRQQELICKGPEGVSAISSRNCRNVLDCRMQEKCMSQYGNCSPFCGCSTPGRVCSKSLRSAYFGSSSPADIGCSITEKNADGGVVHCRSGNVLGASSMYFTGLDGEIIENWKRVPTGSILKASVKLDQHENTVYYVGEDVLFTCKASGFVFSSGFSWKYLFSNGSSTKANVTKTREDRMSKFLYEEAMIKILYPEISYIICEAPVWNETSWVNTSLRLNVKDSIAPVFLDPENVTLTFYLNDKNKTLVCEAEGFPLPDILWLRGPEEYILDLMFDATRDNITKAVLTFPEITESENGITYTCNASNPRGMIFKKYMIVVKTYPSTLIFSLAGSGMFMIFGIVVLISIILLRKMQNRKNGYVFHFSDFDMEEFKNGNPEAMKMCSDVCEKALYLPYDDKYEVDESDLVIDYENILGHGEFGVVLQGKLTREHTTYPVAVKTLKGTDMNHLKSILSELKIMIYIGSHKNIVTLIGAVTKNLIEKRVLVVVEYCALGNLENYLRQHRATFFDEFGISSNGVREIAAPSPLSYVRIEYLMKTSDLVQWACEIATGMEYLASRKVIHGDLALRNMLLDSNQTIKITDFGLSKQLYKCNANYVTKKKDIPLPWRWLAIETLQDHNFSTQSDIWSFGITLWEIFSLAEVPYFGVTFNIEFLRMLGNGFRLDRPRYANIELYDTMRDCWRKELNQRPSFTTLKQILNRMLPQGSTSTYDSDVDSDGNSPTETIQSLKKDLLPSNNGLTVRV